MKEYVVEAPLSAEAAALLKDPPAARDLLIRILEGGDRRHFQVKTGDRVLEVSSSYPLTADADH